MSPESPKPTLLGRLIARLRGWGKALALWWCRIRQPLLFAAVAAILGISVADWCQMVPFLVWLAAALVAVWAAWKKQRLSLTMLACATTFAALHRLRDSDPLWAWLEAQPDASVRGTVEGIVVDAPEPEPIGTGFSFPLQVENVQGRPLPGLLYVHFHHPVLPKYGDRIRLQGTIRLPPPGRNPGEFDTRGFLRRMGFGGEMKTAAAYYFIDSGQGSRFMAWAIEARKWVAQTVTDGIADDPNISATVRAMVLGTRETTPQEIEDAFIASGTMHLFAVSGLHVALFAAVLFTIMKVLHVPRKWALLALIPLMFFYVYVTGLRPSAWRAAIMATVLLCGPLFSRHANVYNGLGAAALILLAGNTQQTFQPGFQLSFGVLLAIAVLTRPLLQPLRRIYEIDPFMIRSLLSPLQTFRHWLLKKLCECFAVSAASAIGSAPLMLYHFKMLSPIGVVANLLLVFLSSAILFVACVSVLLAALKLSWLVPLANNTNYLLSVISIGTAKFFAAVPGGHFHVDASRWFRGEMQRITVLDVGNGGGAIHLDVGNRHWLIDTGPQDFFSLSLRSHLLRTAGASLEGLILTHRDSQHHGGSGPLQRDFLVRQLFTSQAKARPDSGDRPLVRGDQIDLGGGAVLSVLYPPPGPGHPQADDRCLVLRLDHGGWRILFMGDAGFITEKYLLESGEDLSAHVLVKGRHATDFSGTLEFLNAVRPQAIIFTNSPFPAAESVPKRWVEQLMAKDITTFDQAETGAVILDLHREEIHAEGFVSGQKWTRRAQ